MNYRQMGWRVTFARLLSFSFLLAIFSCLLLYGIGMWFSITEGYALNSLFAATFFYLLMISSLAIFVIYHLWKFPNISITDNGMELKAFFYKTQIDWKSIVRLQKRDKRLLIFLRSSGLLLNRLYGLFDAKVWDQPVVLFVSNEEMINQLDEEIRAHLVKME